MYFPESKDIRKVRCVKITNSFETVSACSEPTSSLAVPVDYKMIVRKTSEPVVEHEPVAHTSDRESEVVGQSARSGCIEIDPLEEVNTSKYPSRRCNRPKYLEDYVVGDNIEDSVEYTVDYCYTLADVPRTCQEAVTSAASSHGG